MKRKFVIGNPDTLIFFAVVSIQIKYSYFASQKSFSIAMGKDLISTFLTCIQKIMHFLTTNDIIEVYVKERYMINYARKLKRKQTNTWRKAHYMQPYFKPKFVLKNFSVHNELELEPGLPDNVPAKVIVIKMLLN